MSNTLNEKQIKIRQDESLELIRIKEREILIKQNELKEYKNSYIQFCQEHKLNHKLSESDKMIEICCNAYFVKHEDIIKKDRRSEYVIPRQVIQYLLYIHFNKRYNKKDKQLFLEYLTLNQIGAKFMGFRGNGLNHATILSNVYKVQDAIKYKFSNEELFDCFERMNKAVNEQMGLKV